MAKKERHTADEWADRFDVQTSIEHPGLLTFWEFAELMVHGEYSFLSREGLRKFREFQG